MAFLVDLFGAQENSDIVQLRLIRVVPLITFYSGNNYSGTSIKRTPLGNSLLAV